ncbi:MAG: hypothetical protein KDA93_20725 [Planctomycetaceae bacterium]|nr:hypothetical protein [Planctomycetaceae bacterium]
MSIKVCDFFRSFVTFRLDFEKKPPATVSHQPPFSLNNARIPLESRLQITEKPSGNVQTFVQGASCKTERVGVERDIWTEPNADFVPIFSEDRFLNIKTFAEAGMEVDLYPPGSGKQSERQVGVIDEVFDSVRIDISECEAELLDGAEAIVNAVLANDPLVAQTVWETERYRALLEYPVKTINASERHWVYQTDTGPHLYPDLSVEPDRLLDSLQLAFSAFNCPQWIEFLVREPTPITEGVKVYHYSRSVRVDCENSVLRVVPSVS